MLDQILISLFFLLSAVGDQVSEDEIVCEIETDKVCIILKFPVLHSCFQNMSVIIKWK